jgi:predicted phosphodiesterase
MFSRESERRPRKAVDMSGHWKFLSRLLIIAALISPILGAFQNPVKPAIIHGPYLQNPTENSMTIIWFTNKPCTSWVEYGSGESLPTFPKFGSLISIAKSGRDGLIDANTTRHEVRLSGLLPSKTYRYRVVSKDILQFAPYEVVYGDTVVSDIFQFRILDPKKSAFRFQVFQDLHGDTAKLESLFQQPGWETSDLLFFNGDTLSSLDNENVIFNGFLDLAVGRFARNLPFIYIRGNHDTRGALARHLHEYFPPRNGRYYYAFDHGPVHFVILDSGEDKPDDSPVYAGLADFDRYREAQAEWLRQEIRTEAFTNAAFRIFLIHMPPYGGGKGTLAHGVDHLTKLWGPLLNEGGADLVLSGHYHRFFKIEPEAGKNDFPVIGAPPEAFVRADVTAASIDLKIIDIKGNTLDSRTITSKKK